MKLTELAFVKEFIKIATDGWLKQWHERNGGNLSYRLTEQDVLQANPYLGNCGEWLAIRAVVKGLAGEWFLVTGSGKFMRNVALDPIVSIGLIEIDETGERYRIRWGLEKGGKPTSELPTHLMNHEVKKASTNNRHRVIYHAHPTNVIALTFVLPLDEHDFCARLWQMATECPVVFPGGIGIIPWMVPGGPEIGLETARKMEDYDAVIWAHHGMFCSGEDFDVTFGLMDTIEKAATILTTVLSTNRPMLQTITAAQLETLASAFHVRLRKEVLEAVRVQEKDIRKAKES